MQHGEDVVEQVLHAQAEAVQVALRRVRQVGTALLSAAVELAYAFIHGARRETKCILDQSGDKRPDWREKYLGRRPFYAGASVDETTDSLQMCEVL